jgi:hypothetical protein
MKRWRCKSTCLQTKGGTEKSSAPTSGFLRGLGGARAHSRLAPVPGAFSNVHRVSGGVPQTRFRFLNETHFPSGARYPGPPLHPQPLQGERSGQSVPNAGVTNASAAARKISKTRGVRTPYSLMLATMPAPTVRPPSRMAKRSFSSIAIGTISSTSTVMLSPGITISVPSGSDTMPVTSVVRK